MGVRMKERCEQRYGSVDVLALKVDDSLVS